MSLPLCTSPSQMTFFKVGLKSTKKLGNIHKILLFLHVLNEHLSWFDLPFFFHGSVRLTSLIVPLNKLKTVEILEASNSCPVPTSLVRSHDEVLVKQHRTILVAQRPFLSRHFPLSLASSSAARARVFTTSWSSSLLAGHLTPHFLLSTGLH